MKVTRRLSQILFLCLFIFLLINTEYRGRDLITYPVKFFLEFNPLILLSTFISTHSVIKPLLISLLVIGLTVVLGRIFCGWVCPFGAIHNAVSFFKRKKDLKQEEGRWNKNQNLKYYILFFLLIGSLFSLQFIGILDPLSLLVRTLSLAVFPVISFITELAIHKNFLSFKLLYFRQAVLFGSIFLVLSLMNIKKRRFWCKFLCPLGALLSFLSYFGILRLNVNEQCNACKLCLKVCPAGCNPDSSKSWKKQECFICYNCVEECPEQAISLGLSFNRKDKLDLERRYILGSLLGGVLFFPLLKIDPSSKIPSPNLIRPPGSKNEDEFLARCIRCSECMKVCLTNGLQPTTYEAGLQGIWTPVLVPRIGYCEFNCTLCTQVCPTGAIKNLTLKEKQKVKLGLAFIDKNRCLPYAFGIDCIVCEEHCPTSPKAIWLREESLITKEGNQKIIKQPIVSPKLCIGCGICENKCPVSDKPAIYVTSINETRPKINRLTI